MEADKKYHYFVRLPGITWKMQIFNSPPQGGGGETY